MNWLKTNWLLLILLALQAFTLWATIGADVHARLAHNGVLRVQFQLVDVCIRLGCKQIPMAPE